MESILSCTGVSVSYTQNNSNVPVVSDVSFSVARGEIVSVIGRSGVGKTTLLRLAAGSLNPNEGLVTVCGTAPENARKDKLIGLVSQEDSLLPWLNVEDNIRISLTMGRTLQESHIDPIDVMLESVGLLQYAGFYPHQLSAGMKQRAAIARAFIHKPDLILLDEPFGHLDEITRTVLRETLIGLCRETKTSVLLVTHSIDEALAVSDRGLTLAGIPSTLTNQMNIDEVSRSDLASRNLLLESLSFERVN